MVKNLPANAGDAGSCLDREDSLEKEMATHSSILEKRNYKGMHEFVRMLKRKKRSYE